MEINYTLVFEALVLLGCQLSLNYIYVREKDRKHVSGCLEMGEGQGKLDGNDCKDPLGVIDIFIILIVVVVMVCTYVKNQIACFKNVQHVVIKKRNLENKGLTGSYR